MANVAQIVVGRGQDLWGLAGQALLLESFHYQQSAKFRLFSYSAILAALAGKDLTAAAASALTGSSKTCTAVFSSTSSSFSASPSSQFHFRSPDTSSALFPVSYSYFLCRQLR